MKRIETMEELRALPSGTVLDFQTSCIGNGARWETRHSYLVIDRETKRELPAWFEVVVGEDEELLAGGRSLAARVRFDNGHFEYMMVDLDFFSDGRIPAQDYQSYFEKCFIFVLEPGEVAKLVNKLLMLADKAAALGYSATALLRRD